MDDKFNDIFETIKLLHKKYNSPDYFNNLDNFNKSSKDLEQVLEKYNTDRNKRRRRGKRKISER